MENIIFYIFLLGFKVKYSGSFYREKVDFYNYAFANKKDYLLKNYFEMQIMLKK
jgi:hypothetical protein